MVTAYGDDERRRRASQHRAGEFITKPVDFDFPKARLRQLSPPPEGNAVPGPAKIRDDAWAFAGFVAKCTGDGVPIYFRYPQKPLPQALCFSQ